MNGQPGAGRLSRRRLLQLGGIGGAGLAVAGAYAIAASARRSPLPGAAPNGQFPVNPYISKTEHLDSLPAPKLSFYKQPWRGYMQTVPATQFLAGIGMNYSLPNGADHDSALALLADSGVRHIRVEIGWSQVPWDESGLVDHDYFSAIFAACKKRGITPLVLLNAHHGAPGPNRFYERTLVSGGERGSRSVVLDSVQDLVKDRSGLSNLSDYKQCEVLITGINSATATVQLSKPLPKAIAKGSKIPVHTFKYLPLHPVGTAQFVETMAGWGRYVDLALGVVVASGIGDFEVEIWNELVFGSDYLSINNYYEKPIASTDHDFLQKGGQAWELGRQTADRVKRGYRGGRVIWGFSNTDFYHTRIPDLPPGVDGQSYHPYGTNRQEVPKDFPAKDQTSQFVEGFVPRLSWCMPEGWAHLGTKLEQLIRGVLQPGVRASALPPNAGSFAHYMTEHGFVASEAGISERDAIQSYKARALIRALTFWLNKGISRIDIYTLYEEQDSAAGILWSSPKPATYSVQNPPPRSPALTALRNLVRQFQDAQPLSQARQLDVSVAALGGQPEVFAGDSGHPPLYYREMLAVLPFQVNPQRFVVATYVMSYDITRPPPAMSFRLEVKGVQGRRANVRYYDPIQDRELAYREEARADNSVTVTIEQVEYPRLIVIDDR